MKRVANNLCFQTLGYVIGGDQIIVFKDYKTPSDITWERDGEDNSITTLELERFALDGRNTDMADTNIVTLSTQSYNQIKADNTKLEMLVENILLNAGLSDDHQQLVFDSESVRIALQFCFPERYKKKLASMKTQYTRYGLKGEDVADDNKEE